MEIPTETVQSLLLGEATKTQNVESIFMAIGSTELILTIDEIAALPSPADRSIGLQLVIEQIKGKK